MEALCLKPAVNVCDVLETGHVLMLPQPPITLSAANREWLQTIPQNSAYHNIPYKPRVDRICGLGKTSSATRARLREILSEFSQAAIEYAAKLLPRYSRSWTVDYASLHPIEEAGRILPFRKRNDLLHVDAFPSRPTRGGLILRLFVNVNASKPRVWLVSGPFETVARRFARAAGLELIARRRRTLKGLLQRLGFPLAQRSAYDEFMLAFHDYLKASADFQSACPKQRLEFPSGSAWMAFTDLTPHAVVSGQFALEQTFIVPPIALAEPSRAPISILEKIAGQSLS